MEINPQRIYRYFRQLTMKREEKAQEIVRSHMLWSGAAGLAPLPGIDVAAVTAVQLDMINQLCGVYKVEFSENASKSIVTALIGSSLARLGASAIKAIPVVGFLVGGPTMALLSMASTYAVGQVFVTHFENNGTLADLDFGIARKLYEDAFEKGKEFASKLEREVRMGGAESQPAEAPAAKKAAASALTAVPLAEEDVFEKLEKLARLKERGILTEDEFAAQKAKLLELL